MWNMSEENTNIQVFKTDYLLSEALYGNIWSDRYCSPFQSFILYRIFQIRNDSYNIMLPISNIENALFETWPNPYCIYHIV